MSPPPPLPRTLASLPPELLDYVLSLSQPSALQSTTLALIAALPSSSISKALLFRHLRLTREGQSLQVGRYLRAQAENEGLREAARTVDAMVWRDDAQLLINLLGTFSGLRELRMAVGPLFAPEHLEELLDEPRWKRSIEGLSFRFNPYVSERSYYTFLKGAYFDTTPLTLAGWKPEDAPNLHRLALMQDLPPNHGVAVKATPAFGLSELSEDMTTLSFVSRMSKAPPTEKMDFAQPIVLFKLDCLTTLSLSPLGSQLTHLILRLPRRNLFPSLTTFPSLPRSSPSSLPPKPSPFPSLIHLDLSTSYILLDARLPLLLRLYPSLEHLVLDRCTGLIGKREMEETALVTLKWLGKCCGGIGMGRVMELGREWSKIIKSRPTGMVAPGPQAVEEEVEGKKKRVGRSGFANMPRREKVKEVRKEVRVVWSTDFEGWVKELLFIPPAPRMRSLGLGLWRVESGVEGRWRGAFEGGYGEAMDKTVERVEESLSRWEAWSGLGKLDGTRRMVAFRETLERCGVDFDEGEMDGDDEVYRSFCRERGLVTVGPGQVKQVLAALFEMRSQFVLCLVPDCDETPGVPHLSLEKVGKEAVEEREAREKECWEEEARGWNKWRMPTQMHHVGCAHLATRKEWEEED